MNTGKHIKHLRKENSLTLTELSKRSGVAVATLSRMEANKMPGTLEAYSAICKACGVTLSEFFKEVDTENTAIKIKKSKNIIINKVQYSMSSLANKVKGKMIPFLIDIKPKSSIPEHKSKVDSEKFIYVIEGGITLTVAGIDYSLEKNNSAYFNSSFRHTIQNISSKEAKIISVES